MNTIRYFKVKKANIYLSIDYKLKKYIKIIVKNDDTIFIETSNNDNFYLFIMLFNSEKSNYESSNNIKDEFKHYLEKFKDSLQNNFKDF